MKVSRERTLKLERYGTTYRFDEDFKPEVFDCTIAQKPFEKLIEKGTTRLETWIKQQLGFETLQDHEISELVAKLKKYYTQTTRYRTEMTIEYVVKHAEDNNDPESISLVLYGDEELSKFVNINKLFVKRDKYNNELVLVDPPTGTVVYTLSAKHKAVNYVTVEMTPNYNEEIKIEF